MSRSRRTPAGTLYSGTFGDPPTPEQLEALDAIADAVRKRMGEEPERESPRKTVRPL